MSLHRFFLLAPLAEDGLPAPGETVPIQISSADMRHLQRVLRLGAGDRVVVVEPAGREVIVRLRTVGETLAVTAEEELPARREPRVTLVQGVGKGGKTDLVVEKATEIGAEAVLPVLTARSVVRLDARKRAERGERWRRVAAEAAKQAQRSTVPRVEDPVELAALAPTLAAYDRVVVAWEEATEGRLSAALSGLKPEARVAVVVGPEGGLTTAEVDALSSAGAVTVTLGRNILRTETAGIVALALTVYELGGLGGGE